MSIMTTNSIHASVKVVSEIGKERLRQIKELGWTAEHDDNYNRSELADAAACYALGVGRDVYERVAFHDETGLSNVVQELWPWEPQYDKRPFRSRREQLIIAGALIAAEIERIDRGMINEQEQETEVFEECDR